MATDARTPTERSRRRRNHRSLRQAPLNNDYILPASPSQVPEDASEHPKESVLPELQGTPTGTRTMPLSSGTKSTKRKIAAVQVQRDQIHEPRLDSAQSNKLTMPNNDAHEPHDLGLGASSDGARGDDLLLPKTSQVPRETPQHKVSTPAKQIYAGPLFHASPAASALPLPRQFSKSVSPQIPKALNHMVPNKGDDENEAKDPESPSSRSLSTSHHRPEESPLDIFFNAQRAERQKSLDPCKSSPERPRSLSQTSDRHLAAPTAATFRKSWSDKKTKPNKIHADKQAFLIDVDGMPDDSESEDQSTSSVPFRDRLHALQSTGQDRSSHVQYEERQAKSEALKGILVKSPSKHMPPPSDSTAPPLDQTGSRTQSQRFLDPFPATKTDRGEVGNPTIQSLHVHPLPNESNRSPYERSARPFSASRPSPGYASGLAADFSASKRPPELPSAGNVSSHDTREGNSFHRPDKGIQSGRTETGGVPGQTDLKLLESNLRKVLKLEDRVH